jgi:hypothetical protein
MQRGVCGCGTNCSHTNPRRRTRRTQNSPGSIRQDFAVLSLSNVTTNDLRSTNGKPPIQHANCRVSAVDGAAKMADQTIRTWPYHHRLRTYTDTGHSVLLKHSGVGGDRLYLSGVLVRLKFLHGRSLVQNICFLGRLHALLPCSARTRIARWQERWFAF